MKIEAILDDRRQRREEILTLEKIMFSFGPFLVTILGSAFIMLLDKSDPGNNADGMARRLYEHRGILIALVNQLFYFLGLIAAAGFLILNANSRYIASLEKILNQLLGENIAFWESSSIIIGHSALPYLCAALILMLDVAFGILAFLTFRETGSFTLLAVNIAEFVIIMAAVIWDVTASENNQRTWLETYRSSKNL